MKGIKIKVSGHVIEKNLLNILFGALKDKEADITDIEIFVPTLKGSWNQKCPSIAIFKLISFKEDDLKKSLQEILEIFKENDCRIIYCKDI